MSCDFIEYRVENFEFLLQSSIYKEFDEKLNALLVTAKLIGWKVTYDTEMLNPCIIFIRDNERRELWLLTSINSELLHVVFNGDSFDRSELDIIENEVDKFVSVLERAMKQIGS